MKAEKIKKPVSQYTPFSTLGRASQAPSQTFSDSSELNGYFPRVSRLFQGSGRSLSLPDDVRSSVENHFGYSVDNLKFRESSDVNNIGAKAYTRGDEIHFAPGQFRPDTTQGRKMIGHEIAHVIQQAKGGLGSGGEINLDSTLEQRADRQGEAISSMSPASVPTEASTLAPMPTASFSASPVQGWGVGILKSGTGEHEKLTEEARNKASLFLGNGNALSDKKAKKSLEYGSRFNDVGTHTLPSMGIHMKLLKDDAFINQTHCGDMQFLHSMDTSQGDTQANVQKIRRYAQFASDVYQNEKVAETNASLQDMNMLDYVLSQNEEGDPFQEMFISTMLSPKALKKFDEEFNQEYSTGAVNQGERRKERTRKLIELAQIYQAIEKKDAEAAGEKYDKKGLKGWMRRKIHGNKQDYVNGKVKKARKTNGSGLSQYAQKSVKHFFTGGNRKLDAGLVALGSASHMLEDSFAGSHAIRADNLYMGTQAETDLSDTGQKIADKTTGIIASADYNQQDNALIGGRHGAGDKFVKTKGTLRDTINNTQGGALARDAVAQFMAMNVKLKNGDSQMRGNLTNFVEGITKTETDRTNLGVTSTGRAYDRKFENETRVEARKAIDKYWELTKGNIVGNKIPTARERVQQLGNEINALEQILTYGGTDARKKYTLHANEMLVNIRSMISQLADQEKQQRYIQQDIDGLRQHEQTLQKILNL